MQTLYPWQQTQWQTLMKNLTEGRLAHALLLTGPEGLGKNDFARLFGEALLCEQPESSGLPCGACRSCKLNQAGTHPDLRTLSPLEDKKVIGIDQVREITCYLSLTAQHAGYKIVIITPAESMYVNAANSLLKTLEEPADKSLLLLVSSRASKLPATVRSRCQKITFDIPPKPEAINWLKNKLELAENYELLLDLAEGAPLSAVNLATESRLDERLTLLNDLEMVTNGQADPVKIAANWLKLGAKETLYWVYSWLIDMVRLKVAEKPPHLSNPDIQKRLTDMSSETELTQLYKRLDRVKEAMKLTEGSVNAQLLIEDILISWLPANRIRSQQG